MREKRPATETSARDDGAPSVGTTAGKRTSAELLGAVQRSTAAASAPQQLQVASPAPGADPFDFSFGGKDAAPLESPEGSAEEAAAAGKGDDEEAKGPAPTLSASLIQMRESDIPTTPQGGLSYTTVSGPTSKDPGGFSWVVQWELSGASPKGGWIVQHVKVTADVKDKAGKVISSGEDKRFGYWEAWQVNKGQKITTYAEGGDTADDTYARPKSGDDTKGEVKVEGSAEFYEDLTLPKSFKADKKSPAGILPIVRSKPTLAGGTGAIAHNLTATWDATGGDKKTKIVTV